MQLKQMHFIWMGNLISQEDIDNIIAWRDFLAGIGHSMTMVIWTDRVEETIAAVDGPDHVNALVMSVADLDATLAGYRDRLTQQGALGFTHVPSGDMWDGLCAYAVANRDAGVVGRNYGISSDIYRMVILHEYGGVYMDCDNSPRDVFSGTNGTRGAWTIPEGGMLRTPSSGNSSIVAAKGANGPLKTLMCMAGQREGLRQTRHARDEIIGWAETARQAGENWLGDPCPEAQALHQGWQRLIEQHLGDAGDMSELDLQRLFLGVPLGDMQKTPGPNSDMGGPFWNPRYKFTTQATGPSLFDALEGTVLVDEDVVEPTSLELSGWVQVGRAHAWA